MQNLGGTNKEYHGIFRCGLWSLIVTVVLFRAYVVFCYLHCAFLLELRRRARVIKC